jgi:hypothetical protein
MIAAVIGLIGGVFYWLGAYNLAFWLLIYAIVYGSLGVLRGDNHTQPLYRAGAGFIITMLIPVAWHIGELAGYF